MYRLLVAILFLSFLQNAAMAQEKPKWLNTEEYPFESHYFQLPMGKMHYVDEGKGNPIVMLHGNPGFSFEYRKIIKAFSKTNRCIVPDHIGFGFSDKPKDWDYLPKSHAENFEKFMDSLNLENITMVVNDWGGPIGLAYAIKYPKKIKKLVVLNTFLWSAKGDPHYEKFSKKAGHGMGKFMIKHFNFFGRKIVKMAVGDKKKLTKDVHRHYFKPNTKPSERKGVYVFPREVVGSWQWLDELWSQKDKISGIPTAFVWGMKDIAFREKELNYWMENWKDYTVLKLKNVGHLPQEEDAASVISEMKKLLAK